MKATVIVKRPRRPLPTPVIVPAALPEYLSITEVCEWLGISDWTLRKWRAAGLPVIEIEGWIRFRTETLRLWLNAHERGDDLPTPIRRSA